MFIREGCIIHGFSVNGVENGIEPVFLRMCIYMS